MTNFSIIESSPLAKFFPRLYIHKLFGMSQNLAGIHSKNMAVYSTSQFAKIIVIYIDNNKTKSSFNLWQQPISSRGRLLAGKIGNTL